MEDLKKIILDFAEKGSTFEELEAEMIRLLKENPESASDMLDVLADAREESMMTDQQYNHLLSQLVATETIALTDPGLEDEGETHTADPKQFFSSTGVHKVETVGPGTIIKERFELMEVLGEGGMGMVYKARDLIKVEAKDRNPYLAIKVLNENFRKHPESFIALQRECSRTQRLAHPNIATVYDFDRYGSMVYMTMELLDGEPLNDFIKNHVPAGGLSFEQAYPMIEDMGNALHYAHTKRIVHSDFKPGNSFITKEHGVQVLDFGIARAVKRPGQQDTTLFDAGKLGALTPAYASCEMLEEEEPDPRDDIYALAVVSYILLSGQHPFDKFPATLARDHGMVPKPIKKLTRSQNKALARGLAFNREECTPTVKEFLEELRHTGPGQGRMIAATIAGILVLAVLAFFPVKNYLQSQKEEEIISLLSSSDDRVVRTTLDSLTARTGIDVNNVLSSSRDALLGYYRKQIDSALTGKLGPNNFVLAEELLDEARQWYPESSEVRNLSTRIQQHESRVIDHIDDMFNKIVGEGDVYAAGTGKSVPQLYALLSEIEPRHSLHADGRLPLVYAAMIDRALAEKRLLDADTLLKEASALFGGHEAVQSVKQEYDLQSRAGYEAVPDEEKLRRESRVQRRDELFSAASVAGIKRSMIIKAHAGQPDKARKQLETLSTILSGDDPFIRDTGPGLVADAYMNQAEPLAEQGQYERAIELISSGLEVDPDNQSLLQAMEKYRKATGI